MVNWIYERNPELLSGVAVKKTQARMYRAFIDSQASKEDVEATVRRDVRKLLSDDDLSIELVGRFLAVCGYELDVHIRPIPTQSALPAAPADRAPESLRGVSGPPADSLVSALPLAA